MLRLLPSFRPITYALLTLVLGSQLVQVLYFHILDSFCSGSFQPTSSVGLLCSATATVVRAFDIRAGYSLENEITVLARAEILVGDYGRLIQNLNQTTRALGSLDAFDLTIHDMLAAVNTKGIRNRGPIRRQIFLVKHNAIEVVDRILDFADYFATGPLVCTTPLPTKPKAILNYVLPHQFNSETKEDVKQTVFTFSCLGYIGQNLSQKNQRISDAISMLKYNFNLLEEAIAEGLHLSLEEETGAPARFAKWFDRSNSRPPTHISALLTIQEHTYDHAIRVVFDELEHAATTSHHMLSSIHQAQKAIDEVVSSPRGGFYSCTPKTLDTLRKIRSTVIGNFGKAGSDLGKVREVAEIYLEKNQFLN